MSTYFQFREEYLSAAIDEAVPYFKSKGYELPSNIKVSCGWPVGSRGGKKVMGQCFDPSASKSGAVEIFISPSLENPITVLGVLFHELVHAAVGNAAGHGPKFKLACQRLGLEGKATSAMPGHDLNVWLEETRQAVLGDYPHSTVDYSQRKKQGTRLIKLVCPVSGYTVRTTQKWIEHGLPMSPAGHEMVVSE